MKITIDYAGTFTLEGNVADLEQIYIAMDNWLSVLWFDERWKQNERARTLWRPRVQEITESINDAFNAWEKQDESDVRASILRNHDAEDHKER